MFSSKKEQSSLKNQNLDDLKFPAKEKSSKTGKLVKLAAGILTLLPSGCAMQRPFIEKPKPPVPAASRQVQEQKKNDFTLANITSRETIVTNTVYGAIIHSVYGNPKVMTENTREKCFNQSLELAKKIRDERLGIFSSNSNPLVNARVQKMANEGGAKIAERNIKYINAATTIIDDPRQAIANGSIHDIQNELQERLRKLNQCNNPIWKDEARNIYFTLNNIKNFLQNPDDQNIQFSLAQNLISTVGIGNVHDKYLAASENKAPILANELLECYKRGGTEMRIDPDLENLKASFALLSQANQEELVTNFTKDPVYVLHEHKYQVLRYNRL